MPKMHYISIYILLITVIITINARLSSSSKSLGDSYRSCPEEYRELCRRDDDLSLESDDDQWREKICEQTMNIAKHRNNVKLNPSILRTYCSHYDESLAMIRENNNTLCENKKQELYMKIKRNELQNKRYDNDDDDDDDKRQAFA